MKIDEIKGEDKFSAKIFHQKTLENFSDLMSVLAF